MWETSHLRLLVEWLEHADTIIGYNLPFDIAYLRLFSPALYAALSGRHTLIDASIWNFLQCEVSPEKSLKDVGPVLGLYRYSAEKTLRDHRFPSPLDPEHRRYNASDTWNSVLAAAEFAARIDDEFPGTDKLSPYCVTYFSDLMWNVTRMSISGVPYSRPKLVALETTARNTLSETGHRLLTSHGTRVKGPKSYNERVALLRRAYDYIDDHCNVEELLGQPTIYGSPYEKGGPGREPKQITEYTKGGQLSTSAVNRAQAKAALEHCPADHTRDVLLEALSDWSEYEEAFGLITRFTAPRLRRRTNKGSAKSVYDCILCPPNLAESKALGVWLAHPIWFLVPSSVKDSWGPEGGQKQARPGAQKPAPQQDPPSMQECCVSRFKDGVICSGDLSQIELRVPALISGEPTMVKNYQEDGDLHTDRALYLWRDEPNYFVDKYGEDFLVKGTDGFKQFKEFERDAAKHANFEDLYWAGWLKMQQIFLKMSGRLLPAKFFQQIEKDRPRLRPTLYSWQQSILRDVAKNYRVDIPITGHSRWFMPGRDWKPNEPLNTAVQTPAAITMCAIQNKVHQLMPALSYRDPPYHLCMNWYDALVFDTRASHLSAVKQVFEEAVRYVENEGFWSFLQDKYNRRIPLIYEFKS